jgi:hypothetical protein
MNEYASPPSRATLEKYGMTEKDWHVCLQKQGGKCPICQTPIVTKKVITTIGKTEDRDGEERTTSRSNGVIDHVHVRGWKDMSPKERRGYVRGVCCSFCNRFYLAKKMTLGKAKNIITYLEGFERATGQSARGGVK